MKKYPAEEVRELFLTNLSMASMRQTIQKLEAQLAIAKAENERLTAQGSAPNSQRRSSNLLGFRAECRKLKQTYNAQSLQLAAKTAECELAQAQLRDKELCLLKLSEFMQGLGYVGELTKEAGNKLREIALRETPSKVLEKILVEEVLPKVENLLDLWGLNCEPPAPNSQTLAKKPAKG
jgi:hypothetical protein